MFDFVIRAQEAKETTEAWRLRAQALDGLQREHLTVAPPPGTTAVQVYVADAHRPRDKSRPLHAVMMDDDNWIWIEPGRSIPPREGRWADLIDFITQEGRYPQAIATMIQTKVVSLL
jgi:hypothetical protein